MTKQKFGAAEEAVLDQKNELIDGVFPRYDAYKADTKWNRKRFREHLKIDLTEDVTDIYAFGDFLGIDYKVLIAFNCESSTFKRIVQINGLALSNREDDRGLHFMDEFPWWNKEQIAKLKPFKAGAEHAFWKYLWYDTASKQAYYEEYSL